MPTIKQADFKSSLEVDHRSSFHEESLSYQLGMEVVIDNTISLGTYKITKRRDWEIFEAFRDFRALPDIVDWISA